MERMNLKALSIIFLMSCAALLAKAQDAESLFHRANEAYSAGNYELAIATYDSILTDHMHAESEFNLGNAHYKMQSWAKAILHYERAALLSPNNPDIKTNLTLANSKTKDRIESIPSNGLFDIWERVTAPGRFQFWMIIMIISWNVAWASFAWRIWVKKTEIRRVLGSVATIMLSIGLLTLFFTYSTAQRIQCSQSAIVMATETSVHNEPGNESLVLFMLHEGTKVTVLQREADFWKVQLSNGNTGWMTSGDLEEI